jgi:hypothetical protein
MGTIDESAIDRMSLVSSISERILEKNNTTLENSPYFIWLLRDFYLDLKHEGKSISSKQYLELSLKTQSNEKNEKIKKRNEIRESILKIFPNRNCFALVRPINEEKKMQDMANCTVKDFREEFIKQTRELLNDIIKNINIKMIKSLEITGKCKFNIKNSLYKINRKLCRIHQQWNSTRYKRLL